MTAPHTPGGLPVYLDAAAVARLMGLPSAEAFLARRLELEDRQGFPVSLPWWRRPMRWRADQVQLWLEGQGRPRGDAPDIDPALIASGKVRLLAEARRP